MGLMGITATGAKAGDARIASVYTDLAACAASRMTQTHNEALTDNGMDSPLRCEGPAGFSIVESYSAAGTYRSVEHEGKGLSSPLIPVAAACPQAFFADKVEWRIANGTPFAVIAHVRCYGSESGADGSYDVAPNKLGEYLMVRAIVDGPFARDIDVAATEHPNRLAREYADSMAKPVRP